MALIIEVVTGLPSHDVTSPLCEDSTTSVPGKYVRRGFLQAYSPEQREVFSHFAEYGEERVSFKVEEGRHHSAGVSSHDVITLLQTALPEKRLRSPGSF